MSSGFLSPSSTHGPALGTSGVAKHEGGQATVAFHPQCSGSVDSRYPWRPQIDNSCLFKQGGRNRGADDAGHPGDEQDSYKGIPSISRL